MNPPKQYRHRVTPWVARNSYIFKFVIMKSTKVMVVSFLILVLTWLIVGTVVYCVSSLPMKSILSSQYMALWMFIFGWIPAVIVGSDYKEELNKK
jgi:hypothetical protein